GVEGALKAGGHRGGSGFGGAGGWCRRTRALSWSRTKARWASRCAGAGQLAVGAQPRPGDEQGDVGLRQPMRVVRPQEELEGGQRGRPRRGGRRGWLEQRQLRAFAPPPGSALARATSFIINH